MKRKLAITLSIAAFMVAGIPALIIGGVSDSSAVVKSGMITTAYARAYKGPLCTNGSGTYCCKNSSGECSASATCTNCKTDPEIGG